MEIRYVQEARHGCQIGCFELQVPPGSNVPPPHSHPASEELVYVLEGTLRYSVGVRRETCSPAMRWLLHVAWSTGSAIRTGSWLGHS